MSTPPREATVASFTRLATILRVGTVVAVATIAAGMIWALVAGAPGATDQSVVELASRGGPDALIGIGLLGLAVVPILALGSAVATFVRAGERRPVVVSTTVLLLVLASLVASVVLGSP